MTHAVVSVDMDQTLETVKHIFDNVPFHHLLVMSDDKLMGVISDRDLLKNISPTVGTGLESTRDLATLKKRAHQIMSRNLITLPAHSKVSEAIAIFNQHKISCIPIVDENFAPVGIVSWRDILKALADH